MNLNPVGWPSSSVQAFRQRWPVAGTGVQPALLLEPLGTASGAWSTSGTGFGVNAPSGFAGNLLDLQVGGFNMIKIYGLFSNAVTNIQKGTGATIEFEGNSLYLTTQGIRAFGFGQSHVAVLDTAGLQYRNDVRPGSGSIIAQTIAEAANTLAQRNGTNAQTYRVYNTYTSSTNYERAKLEWSSNVLNIGTEKGSGGGTARSMALQTDGTDRLALDTTGSVRVVTALTVATLPASPTVGMIARVTNALSPTVGSTVAGGGSANALCWYNGTNWTVLGI